MAKPKLALVPSTIGTKVYSVLPSDGDGDFTFTRATKATRINSQGLIEEVLEGRNRLNYSWLDGEVQECPHLLLEPARTNLITNSENFGSGWTLDDATIVSNSTTSPDGNSNATLFKGNTNSSRHNLVTSGSASNTGALSLYVKAKELRYIQIASANTTNQYVNFDVENGIVGTVGSSFSNAKIEAIGSDGWYRCSVVSNNQYNGFYINLVSGLNAGWNESWTMPNSTDGLYIWGAQLEAGSYATSYIKTTAGAVTRNAEVANGAGNASTFNNTKGVLMTEMASLVNTNSAYNSFSIGAGSTNVLSVGFTNALDTLYVYKTNGTAAWLGQVPIVDIAKFNKVALRYNGSNNEFWVNGFKLATNNTIGVHASAMSDMDFNAAFGGEPMYSKTKQVQYFDSELSDAQLEELTSWVSFREMANGQGYIIE